MSFMENKIDIHIIMLRVAERRTLRVEMETEEKLRTIV
jgi:hypothetical protein